MRLNVEDSAFQDPRLPKLSRKLAALNIEAAEVSYCSAVGMLCILWHRSQSEFLIHVTRDQVDLWLFDGATDLLLSLAYLKEEPEGLRVAGNREQLQGLADWREQRRAAGKRSAERRAEGGSGSREPNGRWAPSTERHRTTPNDRSVKAERPFNDSRTTPNATEDNSDQIRSDQIKELNTICGNASLVPATPTEMPKKRAKKEKPETPAGSLVWAAYRASMQEHWRLDPPRSAKTASQAKQLAELLGVERATKLAAYYPTRRSNWYVSKGHPFGLLLTDHMALLRELENGIKFTPQVVKRIVDKEETETSCQVMELMPEENVLCMSDEEFAAWQAKKQAFLEANEKLQIGGDHEIF